MLIFAVCRELAQAAQAAGATGGAAPDSSAGADEGTDGPRKAKGKVVDAEVVDDDK